MDQNQIDNLLLLKNTEHKENHKEKYIDHYLEQYRIYIHVFNSLSDRRQKSNEFFLGLNTAIIGMLGYLETKSISHNESVIFLVAPFVGMGICFCWYRLILSYKQLNQAKFKVIHRLETKLPASLFETEWELLGRGKDMKRYRPLSSIEKNIPAIFIVLYILIFVTNFVFDFSMILDK